MEAAGWSGGRSRRRWRRGKPPCRARSLRSVRSRRTSGLGRWSVGGGESAGAKPSPTAANGREPKRNEHRSIGAERIARSKAGATGIGALRGVPARKGRTRRRLGRGDYAERRDMPHHRPFSRRRHRDRCGIISHSAGSETSPNALKYGRGVGQRSIAIDFSVCLLRSL